MRKQLLFTPKTIEDMSPKWRKSKHGLRSAKKINNRSIAPFNCYNKRAKKYISQAPKSINNQERLRLQICDELKIIPCAKPLIPLGDNAMGNKIFDLISRRGSEIFNRDYYWIEAVPRLTKDVKKFWECEDIIPGLEDKSAATGSSHLSWCLCTALYRNTGNYYFNNFNNFIDCIDMYSKRKTVYDLRGW